MLEKNSFFLNGCVCVCVSLFSFPSLFESERGSDLSLMVGSEGSMERIPAHSWVLTHDNDYFRTHIRNNNNNNTLEFKHDQPNAFINFIR